jgi:CHAT domain-containing protein
MMLNDTSPYSFIDYIVRILPIQDGRYKVTYGLKLFNTNQSYETSLSEFDLQAQAELIEIIKDLVVDAERITPEQLKSLGQKLYGILFEPNELRNHYQDTIKLLRTISAGVCLCLQIEAPELAALPWEYLYDNDYLANSSRRTLVRQLPPVLSAQIGEQEKLKILFVNAEGTVVNSATYDWFGAQIKEVKKALGQSVISKSIKSESFKTFKDKLKKYNPHMLHLVAHGVFSANEANRGGSIRIGGEEEEPVSAVEFANVLKECKNLRLVVLSVCKSSMLTETNFDSTKLDIYASVAATLLKNDIPAVVAMQYNIGADTAKSFMACFYTALASGDKSLQEALALARNQLITSHETNAEWGVPTLIFREGADDLFVRLTPKRSARELKETLEVSQENFKKVITTNLSTVITTLRDADLSEHEQSVLTYGVEKFLTEFVVFQEQITQFSVKLNVAGQSEDVSKDTPATEGNFSRNASIEAEQMVESS